MLLPRNDDLANKIGREYVFKPRKPYQPKKTRKGKRVRGKTNRMAKRSR
jgi:hypothetical protein